MSRQHLAEQKSHYEGGSTRSAKRERYDLVPVEIEEATALRFGLGAEKHGDNNWKKGGAEFIVTCFNHMRGHYTSLVRNGPWHEDDDLGAILWNAGVLTWFRKHKPEEFKKALAMLGSSAPQQQHGESDHGSHPI